jgi:hypothetical protein
MPRPNAHALERSLNAMTVGLVVDRVERQQREHPLRLDETDQVFQLTCDGFAGPVIEQWTVLTIPFSYTFVYSPSQRDVPYETPQFTWGFELLSRDPVVMACHVLGWAREDTDPQISAQITVTGVKLGVAAFIPGWEDNPIKYRGLLHLTFGGFAGPGDNDTEGD